MMIRLNAKPKMKVAKKPKRPNYRSRRIEYSIEFFFRLIAFSIILNKLFNKLSSFTSFKLIFLCNAEKLQLGKIFYNFEKLLLNITYLILL